jgi:hypothetical protein
VFDSFTILVAWSFSKHRNAQVFTNESRQRSVRDLVTQIVEKWDIWRVAGLGGSRNIAKGWP